MIHKTDLYWLLAGIVVGLLIGFFVGKGMYQTHDSIKIKRDTVTIHDTIPDINPSAKDSSFVRWKVKWLPLYHHSTDTILSENYAQDEYKIMHDTVAVYMPITSKHYSSDEYDAYVSGYEPSLDSIKVYQRTQYITEIKEITKSVKPKRFGLGINAGYEYDFKDKKFKPCVGVGISYNLVTF